MPRQSQVAADDAAIAPRLLAWYDRHRRDLPWRSAPGERPDPYRVWLSEIMLQQTTVAAARDYFARFVARWPTVDHLAAASLDDVLEAWAGLGYYARARNLHACAIRVSRDLEGRFPRTVEALRALPGIGPYTAAAIAAIAFDLPAAAVDGNAERVIARLFAIATPLPEAKREIAARAAGLVPPSRPGDFAQALMDLGAGVCTARRPACPACPLSAACAGRARGMAEELPRRRARAKRPTRYGIVFFAERADGAVLLRRRPPNGLLGGMMEVPSGPWGGNPAVDAGAPPLAGDWRPHGTPVEHTFTHFHLVLRILRARFPVGTGAPAGGRWVERRAIAREALPSLMRKVVAAVLGPDAVRRREAPSAPAGAGDRSA